MASGTLEVADVFRRYGEAHREQHGGSLSTVQRHAMSAIELCRTAALGVMSSNVMMRHQRVPTTPAATELPQGPSLARPMAG